jgi:hypothetical protein
MRRSVKGTDEITATAGFIPMALSFAVAKDISNSAGIF